MRRPAILLAAFLMVSAVVWWLLRPVKTPVTFQVDADTEIVSVSIDASENTPLAWRVDGLTLARPDAQDAVAVDGEFTAANGSHVQFVRIGSGDLDIRCTRPDLDRQAVGVLEAADGTRQELRAPITFTRIASSGGGTAPPHLFPFAGAVEKIGREVPFAAGIVPLLHSASIQMFAVTRTGPVLVGDTRAVSLGDAIVIEKPAGRAYGFVRVADERVHVQARVVADALRVRRMGSDGYEYEFFRSLSDSLTESRTVQAIWGAIAVVLALASKAPDVDAQSRWWLRLGALSPRRVRRNTR